MKTPNKRIDNPLEFLSTPRAPGTKRATEIRIHDFNEIYINGGQKTSIQQASRCIDCGNPYCEWKCPLHNYIPNWLKLVKDEQFEQAAELMHETNPLPEICGRVCPQDRLCEQACTLQTGFGAVSIGAIEKNIADHALNNKWRPQNLPSQTCDKTVAIIGAGPAGLGCAEYLARRGVTATVFDKYPEIGGLLTFGIPAFKLEKNIIKRRREYLEDIGVRFNLNTEVGKDIQVDTIRSDYDALFLAMGCYTSITGNLLGDNNNRVIKALDFLIGNINKQEQYNIEDAPFIDTKNKNIIVLGGGDTAMDCVRTAIRQQAKSVTCVYRRDLESMPGSPQEVKNAQEEGVNFLFNQQPIAITKNDDLSCTVTLAETKLDNKKPADRKAFLVDHNALSQHKADMVILAFGFQASPADWFDKIGITLKSNGLVCTRTNNKHEQAYSQHTEVNGIFAGGDMVRGADLVVTAIAEGRQAAQEILEYLGV